GFANGVLLLIGNRHGFLRWVAPPGKVGSFLKCLQHNRHSSNQYARGQEPARIYRLNSCSRRENRWGAPACRSARRRKPTRTIQNRGANGSDPRWDIGTFAFGAGRSTKARQETQNGPRALGARGPRVSR